MTPTGIVMFPGKAAKFLGKLGQKLVGKLTVKSDVHGA
jgi:hypothetical protein